MAAEHCCLVFTKLCYINVYKLIQFILTISKLVGANYKVYCINCVVRDIYFITAIHIDYIIYGVNDSVGVQTGGDDDARY